MSQSPVNSGNLQTLAQYRQGWKALNRLLHESKSFSGRETNNAFLNCGDGGRFADISTAIGWDFADDARAIGLIDYDHDGDLDLWVSNRTAPRIRLLENKLKSEANFVSLLLEGNGKTTNRDGIGSRVEVFLKDTPVPLMRTLHAGQSFLSQSSRWLHFGLGKEATIDKVIVHWAAGTSEIFAGISTNDFYHLEQGVGKAVPRKKSSEINWTPGEAELPPATSIARTIPPAGHALPPLETAEGAVLEPTKTTLIALWSRTCPHCQDEFTAWAKEKSAWESSGIELVAFSTDQELRDQCAAYFKEIGADFRLEMATPQAVEMLDALQSSFLDLWMPIPVPSSFLVSAEGEILAVYRGPVSREQVIQDAALAGASPEARRSAATPFEGRWVGDPVQATPQRATDQLVQRAQPLAAIKCLQAALSKPFVKGSKFDRADNLLLLGQLLGQQKRPAEAVPPLREANALMPDDLRILRLLATGLSETNQIEDSKSVLADAISRHPENPEIYQDATRLALARKDYSGALRHVRKAVELLPSDPTVRFSMVQILLLNGEPAEAVENCKAILGSHPNFLPAANQLSQILSTHPDDHIRKPEEAHALASRLCQITKNRDAGHLYALALALANLEKYSEASSLLDRIAQAVPPDSEIGIEIQHALASVKKNQPVRNEAWRNKTADSRAE